MMINEQKRFKAVQAKLINYRNVFRDTSCSKDIILLIGWTEVLMATRKFGDTPPGAGQVVKAQGHHMSALICWVWVVNRASACNVYSSASVSLYI